MEIKLSTHLQDKAGSRAINGVFVEIPHIPKSASPEKRLELAQIALYNLIKAGGANGATKSDLTRALRACKAPEINAALVALEKAGAIYGTISQKDAGRPIITLFIK